jgi:Mrp family chromosome partitioning ATPase/capsular polysaccharide biosynthesis protein
MSTRDQLDARGEWGTGLDEPVRSAPIVGYLRAIRAHWRLCAAIVLAAFVGSAAWLSQRSTHYVAESRLLVSPVPETDTSLADLPLIRAAGGDPERPVRTAATLVNSRQVAQRTAELLGGGQSAQEVDDAVLVTPREGENLIAIRAKETDPALAADVANAYARATLDVRQELLRPLVADAIAATQLELEALPAADTIRRGELQARLGDLRSIADGRDPTLSIAQSAALPSSPDEPPAWLILALALAAGIAIAAATAIMIELLVPGLISDEDELLTVFPSPIIARLPRLPERVGRALAEDRPRAAVEGFRTLRGQLEFRARASGRGMGGDGGPGLRGVIAIVSPSHQDGRTNVAVGLGRAVFATGARPLLVEADVHNPTLAGALALDPGRDLMLLPGSRADISDAAVHAPALGGMEVVVAPSVRNLAMAERLNADIPRILGQARAAADCVIVDTPPLRFASDVLPVLGVADQVVLVVRLRHTPRGDLLSAVELLDHHNIVPTGLVVVGSPQAEAGAWEEEAGVGFELSASRLPASR